MRLPEFAYSEPKSLRKACQALQQENAMAIAGGTDLMMALKNWLKLPERVVDLQRIPRLSRIRFVEGDGLKVGALASLGQLADNKVVRQKYPVLARTALAVGTAQIRAMATVGGNLCQDSLCMYYNRSPMGRHMLERCHKLGGDVCHAVLHSERCWATYAGDLAPVLLVLGASITISAVDGQRLISLNDFYSGDGKRPNILRPGEVVTEIDLPALCPGSRVEYVKVRQRNALDYPVLGIAVHLTMDGEACRQAALALTAVERRPVLVEEAQQLQGSKLEDAAVDALAEAAYRRAHPLNNMSELPPAYRKEMVKVYVRLAVKRALEGAGGGSD